MRSPAALALVLAAASCSSPSADPALEAPWPAPAHPEAASADAPTTSGPTARLQEAFEPRTFSLAEIRARILEGANLNLAAEALRIAEAEAEQEQAALWPNPYILVRKRRVELRDAMNTGFLEVELGQPFELGGKRAARTAQARAAAEAVSEEHRALVCSTLRDAELRFVEILRLQVDLAEARREAEVADSLEDLAAKRLAAGKENRSNTLRFRAAAEQARLAIQDLERRHARACRQMDDLLGLAPGASGGVRGDLERAALSAPDLAAARAALADHPRLRAARKAALAASRAVDSATAAAWPDLTLALSWEREESTGENLAGLLLQLPLPLWNRRQGERAKARAAQSRAGKNLQAQSLSLAVELEAALLDYEKARANAEGQARRVIPPLEESLALARSAYAAGKVAYLDVLSAHLALIRARRARLDHLEKQANAAAEIRYLASGGSARE